MDLVNDDIRKIFRKLGAEHRYINILTGQATEWLPANISELDDELAQLTITTKPPGDLK